MLGWGWLLRALMLFCSLAAFSKNLQADTLPPLLALAKELQCAPNEQAAAAALAKLTALPTGPFGLPSDNPQNNGQVQLYAASIDIVLQVLYQTLQRFPQLQTQAEIPALQWNYCQMVARGQFNDLHFANGQVLQQSAQEPFPADKRGFGIWGFLNPDPKNRHQPKTVQEAAVFPRLHEDLVFRLYQQQCFPHPDTGTLFEEDNTPALPGGGEFKPSNDPPASQPYPYHWQADCQPANPAQTHNTVTAQAQTAPPTARSFIPKWSVKQPSRKKTPLSHFTDTDDWSWPQIKQADGTMTKSPTPANPPNALPPQAKPSKINAQPLADPIAERPKQPGKIKLLALTLDEYAPPPTQEAATVSPSLGSANANASAPLPLPPKNGYGLSGNFYHRAGLTGAMSVGGNASWRPYSYFFVKGGSTYTYLPSNGKFSYSWGIGYDDWHPGTFSLALNNWGPVFPNDGLGLNKASLNLGYKFAANFLKPYHLNGSVTLTEPLSGKPSLSTTWVWSPIEHWFVRVGLQKSLTSADGLSWIYGFGYADSRPFKFSLTYDNWGVNPLAGGKANADPLNFQQNGAVTLSWSWAF